MYYFLELKLYYAKAFIGMFIQCIRKKLRIIQQCKNTYTLVVENRLWISHSYPLDSRSIILSFIKVSFFFLCSLGTVLSGSGTESRNAKTKKKTIIVEYRSIKLADVLPDFRNYYFFKLQHAGAKLTPFTHGCISLTIPALAY